MNRIYEVDEGRPFWKLRPLQLVLTLRAVWSSPRLVAFMLAVSGPVAERSATPSAWARRR